MWSTPIKAHCTQYAAKDSCSLMYGLTHVESFCFFTFI